MTEENSNEDADAPDSQQSFQDLLDYIYKSGIESTDGTFQTLESPSDDSSCVSDGVLTKIIESGVVNQADVSEFNDATVSTPLPSKCESEFLGPMSNDSGYPMSCEAKCSDSLPSFYEIPPQPIKPILESSTPAIPKQNHPGQYSFEVSLGEPHDSVSKNANYTYSSPTGKLYTKLNVACPVHFKCGIEPPVGAVIRAQMVFTQDIHSSDVVSRCPVHRERDLDSPVADHVIQLYKQENHSGVRYFSQNKQQSVIVDYRKPHLDSEWFTVCYKFACRSSCVGGIGRRPVAAVFTLEDHAGFVLGTIIIEVKICSSPGRDRKHDEGLKHKSSSSSTYPLPSKKTRLVVTENSPPPESGYRYLKVKDEFYDVLKRINTAFELAALVSEPQVQEYHAREAQRQSMVNVISDFINKFEK